MVMPWIGLPAVRRTSGFVARATDRDCHLVSPGMLPGGMFPVSATATI